RMLLHQVIHDDPPSPRKLNSRVPRDLETICLKCLEKAPHQRYASAKEIADELARFLSNIPIHARPTSYINRIRRLIARNPTVSALSAAVLLSLILGTAVSIRFAIGESLRALSEGLQRVSADVEAGRARAATRVAELEAGNAKAATRTAESEAAKAKLATDNAQFNFYVSQMRLLQREWESCDVAGMLDSLNRTAPENSAGTDLRGLEWHFWNRLAHKLVLTFPAQRSSVEALAFHPDGRRLISGGRDGSIIITDLAENRKLAQLEAPFSKRVALALSADGNSLAAGGDAS